jgi:hypothetical protein
MRRSLAITGVIAAGMTALAVAAVPAFAAGGPNPNTTNGSGTCAITGTAPANMGMNGTGTPGTGQGYGRGRGMAGGMGAGMAGQGLTTAPSGTLTSDQKSTLAFMVEEEKLAHDVYVALAAKFPADYQFARIANAETMHQTALRTLLTRYGLTDPTAGEAAGEFSTTAFQSLYNDLVASATTAANALDAGISVEQRDIADLTSALTGLTAPDVVQVYTNLRNASQHHLAAFGG